MNRNELTDNIREITNEYYKYYQGTSETELAIIEELADLVESEKKSECIAFMKYWFVDGKEQELQTFDRIYTRFKEYKELLSIEYLRELHDIKYYEAASLLEFCKKNTIHYKLCYGDGSIMYPKWKETLI